MVSSKIKLLQLCKYLRIVKHLSYFSYLFHEKGKLKIKKIKKRKERKKERKKNKNKLQTETFFYGACELGRLIV